MIPIDHSRSTSPYHQLSTQGEASTFNQPATGYNQSASQYRVPSSDHLRQGMGRPSAYPIPAIGQRSLGGVPSTQTHSRPSLAPNRLGHSDSDIAKSRNISESSGVIHKSAAAKSKTEGIKGYTQPRDMTYPQIPRPSHPDRTRQRRYGQSQSTPPIPLLPLPQSQPDHSHPKAPGAPYIQVVVTSHMVLDPAVQELRNLLSRAIRDKEMPQPHTKDLRSTIIRRNKSEAMFKHYEPPKRIAKCQAIRMIQNLLQAARKRIVMA